MEKELLQDFDTKGITNPKQYQALAMRTNDGKCSDRVLFAIKDFESWRDRYGVEITSVKGLAYDPGALLNGALGLTGEAGEVADVIKKHIFHGHPLDVIDLEKELGDVCWYLALLADTLALDLNHIMTRNVNKLRDRYPEGFSESASINRKD